VAAIWAGGGSPLKHTHLGQAENANEDVNLRFFLKIFWLTLVMEKFLLETYGPVGAIFRHLLTIVVTLR
jgi:hypothetical protein